MDGNCQNLFYILYIVCLLRKLLTLWLPILFVRERGKPVVMVPLILYSDDLSGNRTKKWNCINAWSVLLAGLPKAVNAQLQNIHLLSASNKVSPIHLLEPIVEDLLVLQHGVDMYDALLCCEVVVYAPVLACICDNPRASEIVGHLRGNPNAFCRLCLVSRILVCKVLRVYM